MVDHIWNDCMRLRANTPSSGAKILHLFRKTPNNLWTAGPIVFVGGFNPLDQSSQGSQSYRKKSNNCETLTTYRAIDDLIKVYKTDKNILYDCIPDLQSHGRPLEANTTPCCSARPAIARTAHRRRVLSPGRAGNARLEWRGTRTAMAPSMEGNEGGAPSTVLPKVGWFMYVYVKRYMEVLARRHAAFHCSGRSIQITPSDATREPYRPPCARASRVGCGDGDGPSWVVFVESHGWTGGVIDQVIRVDLLVTQLALAAWFANGCDMDAVDNVARSQ